MLKIVGGMGGRSIVSGTVVTCITGSRCCCPDTKVSIATYEIGHITSMVMDLVTLVVFSPIFLLVS